MYRDFFHGDQFLGDKAYRKFQGEQLPLESLFLCLYVTLSMSETLGDRSVFSKTEVSLGGTEVSLTYLATTFRERSVI